MRSAIASASSFTTISMGARVLPLWILRPSAPRARRLSMRKRIQEVRQPRKLLRRVRQRAEKPVIARNWSAPRRSSSGLRAPEFRASARRCARSRSRVDRSSATSALHWIRIRPTSSAKKSARNLQHCKSRLNEQIDAEPVAALSIMNTERIQRGVDEGIGGRDTGYGTPSSRSGQPGDRSLGGLLGDDQELLAK